VAQSLNDNASSSTFLKQFYCRKQSIQKPRRDYSIGFYDNALKKESLSLMAQLNYEAAKKDAPRQEPPNEPKKPPLKPPNTDENRRLKNLRRRRILVIH
jgi:hypothetical protein